jgi:hypothetical protein
LAFWRHKFPNNVFDDYDKLMEIINKSKALQKWYQNTSNLYGYYHEQPSWVLLNPDFRDKWLTDSAEVFEDFKSKRKELMEQRKRLIASIEDELKKLEISEDELTTKFYKDYPLVAINKIPQQGLPEDLFTKHLDKMGDNLDSALERELNAYKERLAKEFIIEGKDKEELIKILKEQI